MPVPAEPASLIELRALMDGHTSRQDEAAIIELLRAIPAADLNALLTQIDLNQLFEDLDNRLFGPDHLDRGLDLLFRERLDAIDYPVRARLIHAVQAGATWKNHEDLVRHMVTDARGEGLTRFKNLINASGSHYDLEKLVYDDIDDDGIRQQIFNHIAREAEGLPQHEVKVLSDIDDTVVCRLHDDRYPRGTVYPGVFALYDELDGGPGTYTAETGDLTFITARPSDALGMIDRYTREALHTHGSPSFSVMQGSWTALRSHAAMGARKIENFDRYHTLFPEYGFVFVGDSGQGDVVAGRGMLAGAPDSVEAVLIHNVTGLDEATRAAWRAEGIVTFDTYAGAATEAFRLGLISREGLTHVAEETTTQMGTVAFDSDEERAAMMTLLETDLAAVERALGAEVMP